MRRASLAAMRSFAVAVAVSFVLGGCATGRRVHDPSSIDSYPLASIDSPRERAGAVPLQDVRDKSSARHASMVLVGVSAVSAASAIGFTIASGLVDGSLRDGGFATGADIAAAADRGSTFNQVAFVSGALAVGALGAAIALYLYSRPAAPARFEGGSSLRDLVRRRGFAF